MDMFSTDQLQKLHSDLRAVGEKAANCVLQAKIQAKAMEFLRGMRDAPDVALRAMDAFAKFTISSMVGTEFHRDRGQSANRATLGYDRAIWAAISWGLFHVPSRGR
jgi:iron only hydrogenase large subunit-like protein